MKKSCLNEVLYNSRGQPKLSITDTESESFADVQTALSNYLNQSSPPGAIFGCNDQITYASILLLRDKGYNVPQDVRVMGFNGFEVHRHLIPNLTTVISSAYEMCESWGLMDLRCIDILYQT